MISAKQAKLDTLKTCNRMSWLNDIEKCIILATNEGKFQITTQINDVDEYILKSDILKKYGYDCFPRRNKTEDIIGIIISWDHM